MAISKDIKPTALDSIPAPLQFSEEDIRHRIYTIRGVQVMLASDLAMMYEVETKRINEAVKRNPMRFPDDFYFQLTKDEWVCLKSQNATMNVDSFSVGYDEEELSRPQNATMNRGRGHNIKYLPYVFTEEGVGQLSAVLKSDVAAMVSVRVQRAFVAMRRYLMANAGIFQRLESLEQFRLEARNNLQLVDKRFEDILDRMDDGSLKHKLGMFFDGQMFESYSLVEELVKRASKRVILIDDYVDAGVLEHFRMRGENATVDVYVNKIHQTYTMKDTFEKYHCQYPTEHVELHTFNKAHDRWLIVDDEVYHFGASIKDLGLKWFSVNLVKEYTADELIARLKN